MIKKIGSCPKCMRTSFLAMVAAGMLTLFVPGAVTMALATGLALLWLTHLSVYAYRAVANPCPAKPQETTDHPRRQFMVSFAKTFVMVMAATAFAPIGAFAASCDCADNLKCCWNYNGDSYVCAPLDANCCAHATSPWYCPEGHNCYGSEGGCS